MEHDSDPRLKPKDWRESLTTMGGIAIVGCHHVDGVKLFACAPMDVWLDEDIVNAKRKEHFPVGCGHQHRRFRSLKIMRRLRQ